MSKLLVYYQHRETDFELGGIGRRNICFFFNDAENLMTELWNNAYMFVFHKCSYEQPVYTGI